MTEELISSIVDAERAARAAMKELEATVSDLAAAYKQTLSNSTAQEIVQGLLGQDHLKLRRATYRAIRDYERASAHIRESLVRVLIDNEHLSVSEVASRLTISRQLTSRLYKQAKGLTTRRKRAT